MNGPQHEVDKRKAERERVASLAAEFQRADPEMIAKAKEAIEELLLVHFYAAKGFAMAAQQPVAKITFEVLLNFAPGKDKGVEVRGCVVPPPVTGLVRREVKVR